MNYLWEVVRATAQLFVHHDPELFGVIDFTLKVALISTVSATVVGLPLGLAIGLGRFRGRTLLRVLANASLGLPPVVVGLFLLLCFAPFGPLGFLSWNATHKGVYTAQSLLALPYVVALTAAAVQGLPPGMLAQARALGAGRVQIGVLALREARIGVIAAVLAALGSSLSEVAAIAIVGGNIFHFDQTLASSALYDSNAGRYTEALASGAVLAVMILIVMGAGGILQQYGGGIRWRLRPAT